MLDTRLFADATGNALLRETRETYDDRLTLPYRARNTSSELWEWLDTTADPADGKTLRKTGTTREFDVWGNVTTLRSLGKLGTSGDERRAVTVYQPNLGKFIVNLPKRELTYAANDTTVLRETRVYYDGATALDTAPATGDATRLDRVLFGTTNQVVSQHFGYDSYGNRTATWQLVPQATGTQELRTETVYDPTFHLFPATVTAFLAPGARAEPRHHGGDGSGLPGAEEDDERQRAGHHLDL